MVWPSDHNFIRKACENLQEKNSIYANSSTTINKRKLVNTRDQLQTAYNTGADEILGHKIAQLNTIQDTWENHQQNHLKEEETKSLTQRQNLIEMKKFDEPFEYVAWRSSNYIFQPPKHSGGLKPCHVYCSFCKEWTT